MNPVQPRPQLLPTGAEATDARARPSTGSSSAPVSPSAAPTRSFAETMRAASAPASLAAPSEVGGLVRNVLQNVASGHREMDRIIKLAQSGRSFSSAQLIGLQARVFRLSTEIDLASKLLEKVTSGVKQTMSTQV